MAPMPRGGRAIWGATRGYRRANRTLRRPDQPYTAWHGHWFRHCPPVITGASPPLHSAILPPSPQPPLPTQSTEAPHLPSRVLGRNLGSRGSLLGLRPAIERTQRAQTNQPTPVALGAREDTFFHFAHAADYGSYGPPRYDTEDGSMGKLGIQRAQIGPYVPPRRRIWLGLA